MRALMANTKSAEKRAREALAARARNVAHRSKVRSAVRKVVAAISEGKKLEAAAALKAASPIIDAMARKGIIHKNKAARHKSRLAAKVKALATAAA
jgi:small subunit ribosomal protein S20